MAGDLGGCRARPARRPPRCRAGLLQCPGHGTAWQRRGDRPEDPRHRARGPAAEGRRHVPPSADGVRERRHVVRAPARRLDPVGPLRLHRGHRHPLGRRPAHHRARLTQRVPTPNGPGVSTSTASIPRITCGAPARSVGRHVPHPLQRRRHVLADLHVLNRCPNSLDSPRRRPAARSPLPPGQRWMSPGVSVRTATPSPDPRRRTSPVWGRTHDWGRSARCGTAPMSCDRISGRARRRAGCRRRGRWRRPGSGTRPCRRAPRSCAWRRS